jgi:WG containing repeat
MCIIDDNNNELIPSRRYSDIWTAYDSSGKFFVVTNFKRKKGIYELGKAEVVPCIYDDINFFLNHGFVSNGEKWAIMSSNFVIKSDYAFDEYGNFDKDGLALVKQDAQWVLIDTSGKIIKKLNYDKAYRFNESDIYKKAGVNGKFGYVDRKYKIKIPFEYEDVGDAISHKNDVFPAKLNGKWGYINSENKVIVPFKYLYATPIYKGFGLLKGENFKTIGLVNSFGQILFDDSRFEDIEYSEESKVIYKIKDPVSKKYLKGYLDSSTLKVIIKAQFDNCESFFKGMALVKKNGLSALIDTANKPILPYNYEFISRWGDNYLVTLKGKTGMIDRKGKIIVPLEYENCSYGGSFATITKNGLKGILHISGKVLVTPTFDNVQTISEKVFYGTKGSDKFLINLNGVKKKIE